MRMCIQLFFFCVAYELYLLCGFFEVVTLESFFLILNSCGPINELMT